MGLFEGTHYGRKLFLLHTVLGADSPSHLKQFYDLIHSHRFEKAQMILVGKGPPVEVQEVIETHFRPDYEIVTIEE